MQALPSLLTVLLTLSLPLLCTASIYTKQSPVLEVTASNYSPLITQSNHTTLLEFYAPWCGHCQSLKPAYESAARQLTGLVTVAAVNCDEELNKPLCGSMGIQGFPTLKIIKPSKKAGKPSVSDYQGPREAKAIVGKMVEEMPNHVRRLKDSAGDVEWIGGKDTRVVLFSDKSFPAPLFKALAVDFLGQLQFGFATKKSAEGLSKLYDLKFDKLPKILFVNDNVPTIYEGKIAKAELSEWIESVSGLSVNPPPAVQTKAKKVKNAASGKTKSKSRSSKSKSTASASSKFSKASEKAKEKSIVSDDFRPAEETILPDPFDGGSGVVKEASPVEEDAQEDQAQPQPMVIPLERVEEQTGTQTGEVPPQPEPVDKGAGEQVKASIRDEL